MKRTSCRKWVATDGTVGLRKDGLVGSQGPTAPLGRHGPRTRAVGDAVSQFLMKGDTPDGHSHRSGRATDRPIEQRCPGRLTPSSYDYVEEPEIVAVVVVDSEEHFGPARQALT